MKKNLILLLIILPIYYLYSIKLPKEPELKSPEIQDESNLKPVIIDIYGTAFKIRGNAYIKEFTLKIKTLKEGFTFYKDISLNSIKEIEIGSSFGNSLITFSNYRAFIVKFFINEILPSNPEKENFIFVFDLKDKNYKIVGISQQ